MANSEAAAAFLQEAKQNIDTAFESLVVIPGDNVTDSVTRLKKSIKIGTGLSHQGDCVVVTTGGCLRYRAPVTYYVETNSKRYYPSTGDHVVAMIEERQGDFYRVNLLSGGSAVLHQLAFEGATKRNKPDLSKGDIIYARVTSALKDVESELVCTASSGVNKEWTTGESVFGQLHGGILIRLGLNMARRLLSPESVTLNCLGRHFKFEVAVGVNGIVWIKSSDVVSSVVIRNSILNASSGRFSELEVEIMIERLVVASKSRKQHADDE